MFESRARLPEREGVRVFNSGLTGIPNMKKARLSIYCHTRSALFATAQFSKKKKVTKKFKYFSPHCDQRNLGERRVSSSSDPR